jgi:hypothetical protein
MSSVVDCDVEGLSVRIPTVVEIIADTMLVETSEVNGSIFENATVDSLLFIGTAIIVEEEEIKQLVFQQPNRQQLLRRPHRQQLLPRQRRSRQHQMLCQHTG